MFGSKKKKDTETAIKFILNQLREYGLEIEVDYRTLEVYIVDLNEKWAT